MVLGSPRVSEITHLSVSHQSIYQTCPDTCPTQFYAYSMDRSQFTSSDWVPLSNISETVAAIFVDSGFRSIKLHYINISNLKPQHNEKSIKHML